MSKSLKTAKKKCWAEFSKYIRTRDCLKTDGTPFAGNCVTCGRRYMFHELQAGHFLSGRGNSILFEETNCHAQCYGCNVMKHGNLENYYPYMLKTYGEDEIDRLKRLKNTTRKFSIGELDLMTEAYREKTPLMC